MHALVISPIIHLLLFGNFTALKKKSVEQINYMWHFEDGIVKNSGLKRGSTEKV